MNHCCTPVTLKKKKKKEGKIYGHSRLFISHTGPFPAIPTPWFLSALASFPPKRSGLAWGGPVRPGLRRSGQGWPEAVRSGLTWRGKMGTERRGRGQQAGQVLYLHGGGCWHRGEASRHRGEASRPRVCASQHRFQPAFLQAALTSGGWGPGSTYLETSLECSFFLYC